MAVYKHGNRVLFRGTAGLDVTDICNDLGIDAKDIYTEAETTEEKRAERSVLKLAGVDFNGTMISATGDDQAGLVAVWSEYKGYLLNRDLILPSQLKAPDADKPAIQAMIDALQFPAVYFTFDNGSKLVIDADNIDALEAVWKPFRMSFFPVPNTE